MTKMAVIFRRIDSLQFLRAFAAIAVMMFHGTKMLDEQIKFRFLNGFFLSGYSGVDVLFVISGFIILHTSSTQGFNLLYFFKKRFIRIYPIYWLVTIAILIAYYISHSVSQSSKSEVNLIIGSMALLPQKQYVVGIAWTLTFQVIFSIVFALAYTMGKRFLFSTLITWSAIILILYALHIKASNFIVEALLNPIILEFGFGCLLAYLYEKHKSLKGSGLISTIGIVLFIISWLVYYNAKTADDLAFRSGFSRVYLFGVPAAISIYGLLYFTNKVPAIFIYLGNASYSLYLIHGTVISVLLKILIKLKINDYFSNTAGGLFIFICTIAISCLFYTYVEKPLLLLLSGFKYNATKQPGIFSILKVHNTVFASKV